MPETRPDASNFFTPICPCFLKFNFYILCKIIYLQFFLSRIEDDLSTAIKEYFRAIPDEFVTGLLGSERSNLPRLGTYKENQISATNKDQLESFMNSLLKLINSLEKTSLFGQGKKEDVSIISKELQNIGQLQSKTSFLASNWAGSQDNLMTFLSEFAKIGSSWNNFSEDYENTVIEPMKLLQVNINCKSS